MENRKFYIRNYFFLTAKAAKDHYNTLITIFKSFGIIKN